VIIALASPRPASSLDDAIARIGRLQSEASAQGAEIICCPEAYIPGLRGQDFDVFHDDAAAQQQALDAVAALSVQHDIATIIGMENITPSGREIVSYVFDATGEMQGYQTKNQLDPSEDRFYIPGEMRRLFEINGVKFGIAICHEGWRYPETVRWAAVRGAKIVFHPQLTGTEKSGVLLEQWGSVDNPYYEKAMMMRSRENTIYFASVNYGVRFQEAATSLIDPSGECQAHLPYGKEGILVQEIDPSRATGLLALRYAPDRYVDAATAPATTAERI
jgi:predicted amidohydrolase